MFAGVGNFFFSISGPSSGFHVTSGAHEFAHKKGGEEREIDGPFSLSSLMSKLNPWGSEILVINVIEAFLTFPNPRSKNGIILSCGNDYYVHLLADAMLLCSAGHGTRCMFPLTDGTSCPAKKKPACERERRNRRRDKKGFG